MNVTQFTAAQLDELAGRHLTEHYSEYNPDAAPTESPSWGELADALQIVGLDTLVTEYGDIEFSRDDFICSAVMPRTRSPRHFYAVFHPYGAKAPSPRDILYRYDTPQHREKDMARINLQAIEEGPLYGRGTLMVSVSSKFARKRFPAAFSSDAIVWRSWTDGDRKFNAPWWRDSEDGIQEWTGKPRNVICEAFDILQVDAWHYGDEWVYNETYHLGSFTTAAEDTARAFRRALRNLGIVFIHPHQTMTVYDGDVYEIIDRATGEPMFCAIPREV